MLPWIEYLYKQKTTGRKILNGFSGQTNLRPEYLIRLFVPSMITLNTITFSVLSISTVGFEKTKCFKETEYSLKYFIMCFITYLSLVAILHSLHLNSQWKVDWKRGSTQESMLSRSGKANTGVSLRPEKHRQQAVWVWSQVWVLTEAAVTLSISR